MFWLFRRRKPLSPSPAEILDSAAAILDLRGKCKGVTEDDWGRVDVLGAIKIVIFGTAKPDSTKVRNFGEKWGTYGEVKNLLLKWLMENDSGFKGRIIPSSNISWALSNWSDDNEERMLVELMRRAAREARHMGAVST